eukprot:jgi/Mesen1/7886/ME000420S07028
MASTGLVLFPEEQSAFRLPMSRSLSYGDISIYHGIHIFVATGKVDGSLVPLRVHDSDTIASVKMRIQGLNRGFFMKQQQLVYGGRELSRDESLIKEYGIKAGDTLHLVLKLSDLVFVSAVTHSGKEYTLSVERTRARRVKDLKQRISEEGGLAVDEQQLVLRGEQLDDHCLVDDLVVDGSCQLHLFVNRSSQLQGRSSPGGNSFELSVNTDDILSSRNVSTAPRTLSPRKEKTLPVSIPLLNQGTSGAKVASYTSLGLPEDLGQLFESTKAGLMAGHSPMLTAGGSGGAYFMPDASGTGSAAIFKPADEEPLAMNCPRDLPPSTNGEGLKKGTRVGEGAMREVAAWLLDRPVQDSGAASREGFSGVPPTMMVRCVNKAFNNKQDKWQVNGVVQKGEKIGSLQKFVHAFSDCENMGPALFPVEEVHKIALLDIRLANTDRNGANILVCKGNDPADSLRLVPIDHGYCLPEKFEDCTFEWLYWPQSHQQFSLTSLKYIDALDAEEDLALLEQNGWQLHPDCARVFRISTTLLKLGASLGLTPFDIGSMMVRERLNKRSVMEEIVEEVEQNLLPGSSEAAFFDSFKQVIEERMQQIVTKKNAAKNIPEE